MSYEEEQTRLESLLQEILSDENDTKSLCVDTQLSDKYSPNTDCINNSAYMSA